jgi:hypothetical protein
MIEKKNSEEVWLFKFALESENGEKLERKKTDELMDTIIAWAEKNNCQIGGGYRKPSNDEVDDSPIFNIGS